MKKLENNTKIIYEIVLIMLKMEQLKCKNSHKFVKHYIKLHQLFQELLIHVKNRFLKMFEKLNISQKNQ